MQSLLQFQKDLVVELYMSSVKGEVIVNTIRGSEALSELFEFQVSFSSVDRELNPEKILGTSATIHFKSDGYERFFNGIITQFSQGTTSLKDDIYSTEYFFVMRPSLWLLSLDNNCKMFQNKSALEIIKSVLDDNKIKDVSYKTSKNGSNTRVYCVQYNESSFNFISRLMEDEGIFYYFDHEKTKHTLVITDSSNSYKKLKKDVEFFKNTQEVCPLGKIFNTSKNSFMQVGGYAFADYNYELSQTKLFNKLSAKRKGNLFYEYPGGFSKTTEGEALSKLRVQEIECKYMLLEGDSTVPEFVPGTRFELKLHHCDSFNSSYILYRVEHMFNRTEQNGFIYRNRFFALPKDAEFRAPRKTPKPKIYGNQTAVVVCPSGKEIYRNEHCCIKVHFHWDQEGKAKNTDDSSCWIRVAQLMSGNNWGAVYVPRVGQEVVVSFLEGDPDRPLIVGCVYNDQFTPPYPDSKDMLSTFKSATFKKDTGFNEIRFNDEKEKEEFYIHAEKDMNIDVIEARETNIKKKNDTLNILEGSRKILLEAKGKEKGNHSLTLNKGNMSTLLKEGNSDFEIKKGDSTIKLEKGNSSIKLSNGDSSIELSKGNSTILLKKGNSDIKLQKGNQTIDINGTCTLTISGDLKIKAKGNVEIEAGKKFSVKSKSSAEIDSKSSVTVNSKSDITCKATKSVNIDGLKVNAKGKVEANLDSKGSTKIKGAAVQIKGIGTIKSSSPMTIVGGGMVKLG